MTRHKLAGYLDGALAADEHHRVRLHLESCGDCRGELEAYARLSSAMSRVERAAPPRDLALRIRVSIARARAAEPWARRAWSWMAVRAENFLAPVAVPATGGLLTSVLVFGLVFYNLLVGVPLGGAVANDVPIYITQPARLVSLAPFAVPGVLDAAGRPDDSVLVLEATVDSHGNAVSYVILAGPDNPSVRRQLDQVVFFSRFRPQRSFGRSEPGRVVLMLSEVRVRG
jgi:hypothetical protein